MNITVRFIRNSDGAFIERDIPWVPSIGETVEIAGWLENGEQLSYEVAAVDHLIGEQYVVHVELADAQ